MQEITLKLPGRGHKPLKTFIKEHTAVKLRQIQDAANFFQQAQEKFHVLEQNSASLTTPEAIRRSFSEYCSTLGEAEKVLILPQLPNVQDLYTAEHRVRVMESKSCSVWGTLYHYHWLDCSGVT